MVTLKDESYIVINEIVHI